MTIQRNVYVHAALGREGLGNMLLPWSRAELFAHEHGLPMLAPQWTHLKLGPLLRRERDKRYYLGLFDNSSYICGIRRYYILCRANRVTPETAMQSVLAKRETGISKPVVVMFRGMEGWDQIKLRIQRDYIRKRLLEIVSTTVKNQLAIDIDEGFVGIHVRRGDKPTLSYKAARPLSKPWDYGFSIEWFKNCVKSLRVALGYQIPVKVFSDAGPEALKELLQMRAVALAKPNESITDIILMSRAKVLVPTSTSSFSLWASYLGGMPTVWYPEYRQTMRVENLKKDCEADLEGNLPKDFVEELRKI